MNKASKQEEIFFNLYEIEEKFLYETIGNYHYSGYYYPIVTDKKVLKLYKLILDIPNIELIMSSVKFELWSDDCSSYVSSFSNFKENILDLLIEYPPLINYKKEVQLIFESED